MPDKLDVAGWSVHVIRKNVNHIIGLL